MSFFALDVETANPDVASICQIGVAEIRDGVVGSEWKSYVNPEDYFDPTLVAVHGIDASAVTNAPKLPELAANLCEMLRDRVVVCHTHFDRTSISRSFQKYELAPPSCTWLDSSRVARRTWPECAQRNYGLKPVCEKIGYKFKHHDALEDAKASGMIMIAAMKLSGASIDEWLLRVKQPIRALTEQPDAASDSNSSTGTFHGEYIVFTGAMLLPRSKASELARCAGATVGDNVSRATTLLVVGDQDVRRLNGHEKSSKHRKAEELILAGQPLRIIQERDFLALVEEKLL